MKWNDIFKCLVLLFSNLIALCGFTSLMVNLCGTEVGIVFSIVACTCTVLVELVLFIAIGIFSDEHYW